jgi:hypothetical protein
MQHAARPEFGRPAQPDRSPLVRKHINALFFMHFTELVITDTESVKKVQLVLVHCTNSRYIASV